jgi:hypothetical protein
VKTWAWRIRLHSINMLSTYTSNCPGLLLCYWYKKLISKQLHKRVVYLPFEFLAFLFLLLTSHLALYSYSMERMEDLNIHADGLYCPQSCRLTAISATSQLLWCVVWFVIRNLMFRCLSSRKWSSRSHSIAWGS